MSRRESIKIKADHVPEERIQELACLSQTQESVIDFKRFSSLLKLLRVVAYSLRFIHNLRSNNGKRKSEHLSAIDLKESRDMIVKLVQAESWKAEIERLKNGKALRKQSGLSSLKPYLDGNGLLRVGED